MAYWILALLQFSHSVLSNSLQPHRLQHTRLPCPSAPLELNQGHVHRVSDAIQPSHSLSSLPLLPSIFPSMNVFSTESVLHIRWPMYWSFSFRISPSNKYSGLISFRMDSLQSKGLSRVFSSTTVQKHLFFGAQLSLLSNSHIHT